MEGGFTVEQIPKIGGHMGTENLINYQKSMIDMMADLPKAVMEHAAATSFEIIAGQLSPGELERFWFKQSAALAVLQEIDHPELETRGLKSPEWICQQVQWNASFSALSEIKTEETALKVFRQIVETIYPLFFSSMLPSANVLATCVNPFVAFSDWFLAYMEANQRAGLFEYQLTRKDERVFHFTCHWCAWNAIHHQLGAPKACEPICYADLVFFPSYCRSFGAVFERPTALGWSEACCDFRFRKV